MATSELLSRVMLQHALFAAVSDVRAATPAGDEPLPLEGEVIGQVRGYAGRMPAEQRRLLQLKLARAFLLELDRGITSGELIASDAESWGGGG
jgi:hypothetical protein